MKMNDYLESGEVDFLEFMTILRRLMSPDLFEDFE